MDSKELKPFDLEQAKAGKPFCSDVTAKDSQNSWSSRITVIGEYGDLVFLGYGYNAYYTYKKAELRMVPEVKKITVVLYKVRGTDHVSATTKVEWDQSRGRRSTVCKKIKEIEVEYEDND